ncbi:glycine betaine/L-proline transport ATP binding subunit [Rubidibacter lacunae KORDI 51-2]|uniref:Glycine betaine/L-proline transport ATP binding subunit n=1 Tax=Rubidibacter lacunae KORDI 51-2 TaxID=582515 RepID=U5DFT6_9CHRO|nr:betaine/proline/choline family ABC transporter ATP-binding protein [Rubidibacter lacunae]ERN40112.1 glycine betaine/L-proline transport ATP binding subunit [Rubidibacter lacunae KORDI 51-2]
MGSSEPKIRVESLVKIFGKKPRSALELFRAGGTCESILEQTGDVLGVAGVSFAIQPGELFVIMGLSGSGKSTLLRCLNRLIEPTSGTVYLDGEDITHAEPDRLRDIRRTKMAMVFQKFALFPHLTVAENAEYGLTVRGMAARERRRRALETLEVVGLSQWADRLPAELSGGMQQRVGLARALATEADVLLMDEAFGALDPLIRRDMQAELLRLQSELHKTIVFVSHDIHEALKIGDRVAVMQAGAFEQVGTPEELVTHPVNDYIRDFMLDVNRAQVLKTGSIVRIVQPIVLGESSVREALEHLQDCDRQQTYLVDSTGRPAGIVEARALAAALAGGCEDIRTVLRAEFPQATASASIEEVAHLGRFGLPVAIVDESGQLAGVVDPADILGSIGRLSQRAVAEEIAAVAAAKPQAII